MEVREVALSLLELRKNGRPRQVKPRHMSDLGLFFNMAPENKTKKPWETWGYIDTKEEKWSRANGQIGVKWEVAGGWLSKKGVIVPEDKIVVIFYVPLKRKEEWTRYISKYRGGLLGGRLVKYPNAPCKSYIMIGREYQPGDGEIIDLIHDMSEKFQI